MTTPPDTPDAQVAGVRESLAVVLYRAIRTGRGPGPVVGWLGGRATPPDEPTQQWRLARALAAELAPAVSERRRATADSVADRETTVG